jgi:hypothetical protein
MSTIVLAREVYNVVNFTFNCHMSDGHSRCSLFLSSNCLLNVDYVFTFRMVVCPHSVVQEFFSNILLVVLN